MQTMSVFDKLIDYWSRQHFLRLNKALLDADIKRFESACGVLIPSDYVNYLKLANGFDSSTELNDLTGQDDEGFEFYPLEQKHFVGSKYLVFCCWTLGFVKYALCMDKSELNGTVVRLTDEFEGYRLADNFSQFINLYLTDDSRLYSAGSVRSNIQLR
jgi:hypothetical protein